VPEGRPNSSLRSQGDKLTKKQEITENGLTRGQSDLDLLQDRKKKKKARRPTSFTHKVSDQRRVLREKRRG